MCTFIVWFWGCYFIILTVPWLQLSSQFVLVGVSQKSLSLDHSYGGVSIQTGVEVAQNSISVQTTGAICKQPKSGLLRIQVLYHLCRSHVKLWVIKSGSWISENIQFGPPAWTEEGCAHQALLQNHPIMLDLKQFQNPQSDLQGSLRIYVTSEQTASIWGTKPLHHVSGKNIYLSASLRLAACVCGVQVPFRRQISITLRRRNRNELYRHGT